MLRAYIANDPSLSLHCVYSDNGESGVNFARDDFERLLDDIRMDSVGCVIVKDLSRFGRNYIEAEEYLEKIFPFLGVRFIAVNDGYDSLDPSTIDSLNPNLVPVGDGFGLRLYIDYDFFPNGVKRDLESKLRGPRKKKSE